MVKSHRSKRHHKKHRGGEGEQADNNSVLNMDEPTAVAEPETAMPENEMATVSATPVPATPAEEEKKGWFSSLFGGSKTKRVRFRMTRKSNRKSKRSGTKRSSTKRSSTKRSSAKRSSAKRKSKRSGSKRSSRKRKGSSRK